MKKLLIILSLSITFTAHAQEKFALVIGNANYINFGVLKNPVNDANDMELVLQSLGFSVDKVIDGSLSQMEDASIRLRNHLSEAGNNSIGFFFYAGHGLELNGVNYLIPSDASIPERNFLRERAFSVQIMIDILNDSRNALNIVVLDACRDFPAAWSRSLSVGLAVVNNPPANHIIMFATAAGEVAKDGTGDNGLFTGCLLNNLKIPDIDVKDAFNRTIEDVRLASNNEQRPAIYSDIGKAVYLGSMPASAQTASAQPSQEQQWQEPAINRQPVTTANPINSWISGEINTFGAGARYEYMLSQKISLGANVYWHIIPDVFSKEDKFNIPYNYLGVDGSFRFYPWGRTFFAGVTLGFRYSVYSGKFPEYNIDLYGPAIGLDMGWKIDVGNTGGFYVQPGITGSVAFGKNKESKFTVVTGSGRLYLGMGYGF